MSAKRMSDEDLAAAVLDAQEASAELHREMMRARENEARALENEARLQQWIDRVRETATGGHPCPEWLVEYLEALQ